MEDKENFAKDINVSHKEQIMINGVDVSKCFHYVNNKEYSCNLSHTPFHYRHCKENPNCYFKQLQRKTQECEELKNKLNEYERAGGILDEGEAWYGLAQRYKQALEEIEKYINSQGIDHKWNMYIQRFRSGVLDIIRGTKDGINEFGSEIDFGTKKDGSNE